MIQSLQQENKALQVQVQELQDMNQRLQAETKVAQRNAHKIVLALENFEGEFSGRAEIIDEMAVALLDGDEEAMEEYCQELQDDACPVDPTVSFREALRDRAVWLIGLLAFQSVSGFILAHNEALLEKHPVIVFFLTMLVGAGGNAGNQASVRVIRGLALGTLNAQTQTQFLVREFKMAVALSCLISVAGFVRAAVFATPLPETIAITSALFMIVFSSICLGAILPLGLKRIGIDPAHSSTTIQVVMDILGVVLAVVMSTVILDSPLGSMIISRLGMK
jgi:Mg/Co/Ni transporter MgtE